MDRESIITSSMTGFLPPLATRTQASPPAYLPPPLAINPHADWRGLPEDALAEVLFRLPVLDLFRLGYLFTPNWLDIWRAKPLMLHDRQFSTPPIAADDVADAITNVLELHVGDGVQLVGGVEGGDEVHGWGGGHELDGGTDGEDDHPGVVVNAGGGGVNGGHYHHDGGLDDDVDDEAGEVVDAEAGDVVGDAGAGPGPGAAVDGAAVDGAAAAAAAGAVGGGQGEGVVVVAPGVGVDEGVISDSDEDLYGYDDIPVPAAGYEIGRVYTFRVESTRWRPDHLDRWFAALERGRAREVILANLFTPGRPHLPPGIRDCTSLLGLYVFFFTVEANHIDPLAVARLRVLGLYGCAAAPGLIRRALLPRSEIQALIIRDSAVLQDGDEGRLAVAATRLRRLTISNSEVVTVTVDNAIQFQDLVAAGPSKLTLTINGVPSLKTLSMDLFTAVLEIDGIAIKAGMVEQPPQMPCVRHLILRVNYTEMGDMVPRQRDDEVTVEEGLVKSYDKHIYEGSNLFDGLQSFKYHLRQIHHRPFRGGKYEVALIKAILDKVGALSVLSMEYSPGSLTSDTLSQLQVTLDIFKLHTPNDAVRGDSVCIAAIEFEQAFSIFQ
uniref:F-box/LRR-repeat protein 15/At3g58940/PEG3-like LRR domain-containing protein n=1 Tax=Oryza brachyantha TaxID=4533 RepID=J3NEN4_ORYBR